MVFAYGASQDFLLGFWERSSNMPQIFKAFLFFLISRTPQVYVCSSEVKTTKDRTCLSLCWKVVLYSFHSCFSFHKVLCTNCWDYPDLVLNSSWNLKYYCKFCILFGLTINYWIIKRGVQIVENIALISHVSKTQKNYLTFWKGDETNFRN